MSDALDGMAREQALRARIIDLEADNARLEQQTVQQQVRNGELCGQIVELGTENRRLRAALESAREGLTLGAYGNSDESCIACLSEGEGHEPSCCICRALGAIDALAATPEGQS